MTTVQVNEMTKKTAYDKLVDWFDLRLGFTKAPLKPIPDYALNPIYWLGLLMALTFGMQGATGMFMLLYYVPTPTEAYSSTTFIINSVPLGQLVETLHLYTAYAMILLVFLHLARNYFGSAHKENRILMWLAGIILGVTVLAFGVTGYLLPWTVISKSATDVAVGFVNFFPAAIANLAKFFLVGSGSDATEVNNFLHIHTVILPAVLLVFLALKVYMYEVHGPAYVSAFGKPKKGKIFPWFPKIFLYAVILFSVYIAILVAVSALVPLVLPPAFSAETAGQYVVQPDWYLLWLYQILKVQAFEGPEAIYAIAALGVFAVLLFLLPFYDRSKRRKLGQRPVFITIGAVLVVELVALTAWGYLTPGQVISNLQAVLVLGGLAVATSIVMWLIYRTRRVAATILPSISEAKSPLTPAPETPQAAAKSKLKPEQARNQIKLASQSMRSWFTFLFVFFLIIASASLASIVNLIPNFWTSMPFLFLAAIFFTGSVYAMCRMLRGYVIAYEKGVTAQ
jgi:quinol-cytochrome oxidoreductase complex cytochrome b subunit